MSFGVHKLLLEKIGHISVMEANVGVGLPIVFLHGSGFRKEVFHSQFESPRLRGHHLLAFDLPGHGGSDDALNPEETYSYAGLADVTLKFIERCEIERCVVAGWSLGGQAALELLDASPRVAGVFAFGAPPAPNGALGLIRSMRFCRLLLLAGKDRFTRNDAEYFEAACLSGMESGEYVSALLRTDPRMRPSISRSILYPSGMSQIQRVQESKTPVCLVHGRQEGLVRTSYMQSLRANALHTGRTIIMDDAGHAPFLESPGSFDRLLLDFCQSVENGIVNGADAGPQETKAVA